MPETMTTLIVAVVWSYCWICFVLGPLDRYLTHRFESEDDAGDAPEIRIE